MQPTHDDEPPAAIPGAVREAIATLRHDPVRPHPRIDRVQRAAERWAAGFGLSERPGDFARTRSGWCAAYTYPYADPVLLEIAAELIGWLFLYDDRYGEGLDARVMMDTSDRFLGVVRTGTVPAPAGPFELALADLRHRIRDLTDDAFLERFAHSMSKYHNGWLFELPFRLAGRPPDRTAYRRLRPWSIGQHTVFDLIEISAGPPPAAARERLEPLRDLTGFVCAQVNDLHSYAKETRGGDPINIVTVLAAERGRGLADAARAAVREYHHHLGLLEQGCAALCAEPDATREEVLLTRGLRAWAHGNTAWSGTCARYHAAPPP
ncbi:hypothetical protein NX801_20935 [Streptomyces sp. LP05-1]|uniref:Terpene synthase n=1 Tax=Streptomyces pyxinae TaxID=2970734 RepID=A0ABT2CKY6_9ACTN|nr:hypothetical protein [Streptomyces sp. LP05-1]MCS0638075.1 hypothetical protein [Streptomyces sp. LP05-1]